MNRKIKMFFLLASLAIVVFSCSCLFGRVTNNNAQMQESIHDDAVNTSTAGTGSSQAPAVAIKPAATATQVETQIKKAVTPAPVKKKTKKTSTTARVKAVKPASGRVAELMDRIKKDQADVTAMKTRIKITTYAEGGEPQIIRGEAIIKKKDKFRVHYTEPSEQMLISNGESVWVYTPALNQAIKQDAASTNVNSRFYTDFSGSLDYYVNNSDTELTEDDGSYTLNLKPINKKALDYDAITAKISKKDLMPFFMSFKVQGTVTEIEFADTVGYKESDIEGNTELSSAGFEFKAPKGVEIIDSAELTGGTGK
jgi:outer membrane lipoprotein carrier protein